MIDGIYKNRTTIYFGRSVEPLGYQEIAQSSAYKVLLHYGRESIFRSGLHQRVMEGLHTLGVDVLELGGVHPNPTLSLVREGIALCQRHSIDFISWFLQTLTHPFYEHDV